MLALVFAIGQDFGTGVFYTPAVLFLSPGLFHYGRITATDLFRVMHRFPWLHPS
jgi:hypothetical protein